MHMLHSREMKKGFTMIELLVVVSIMGILSAMGVASLRNAVINNRVKDAAINVTAYLERVASETNRLSEKVCVKASGSRIQATKGACGSTAGALISKYEFEGNENLSFVNSKGGADCAKSWANGETFVPKFGLSAAPVEGCIVVKYGDGDRQARALKKKEKNNIIPQISYDGGTHWMGL